MFWSTRCELLSNQEQIQLIWLYKGDKLLNILYTSSYQIKHTYNTFLPSFPLRLPSSFFFPSPPNIAMHWNLTLTLICTYQYHQCLDNSHVQWLQCLSWSICHCRIQLTLLKLTLFLISVYNFCLVFLLFSLSFFFLWFICYICNILPGFWHWQFFSFPIESHWTNLFVFILWSKIILNFKINFRFF